jgi:hypothetical protein
MKKHAAIIIVIGLISCSENTKNISSRQNDSNSKFTNTVVERDKIFQQTFVIGDRRFIGDDCIPYFECDCCYGSIVFLDSIFYHIDYCIGGDYLLSGTYTLNDGRLELQYYPQVAYWEQFSDDWSDPDNPPYEVKTKNIQESNQMYTSTMCKGRLTFLGMTTENAMTITNEKHFDFLNEINEFGLIDELKKIIDY